MEGAGEERGCLISSWSPAWSHSWKSCLHEGLCESWGHEHPAEGTSSDPVGGRRRAVWHYLLKCKTSNTRTQWFSFSIRSLEMHPHLPMRRHVKNVDSLSSVDYLSSLKKTSQTTKWKERKPLKCQSTNKPHLFSVMQEYAKIKKSVVEICTDMEKSVTHTHE